MTPEDRVRALYRAAYAASSMVPGCSCPLPGDIEDAIRVAENEALERAAKIAGADAVILDHLADAYRALRRPADAEGAWRRALRCVDDQSPAEAAKLRAAIERKLRGGAAATAPSRAP